ncbi:hypothetical protein [Lacimicrobium alkaliphilum]|uniref:hypothetical protein n=1 Tax=Lacimicrobium alkaliphilum TaxID=1526571 RepID=UPI000B053BAD|nr:hypothetical protein [Lacimicrobium alkaliphilum]
MSSGRTHLFATLIALAPGFAAYAQQNTDDGWQLGADSEQNSAQQQDDWGWEDDDWGIEETSAGLPVHGFAELALGRRTESSPYHDALSLGDARLRLETSYQWQEISFEAKAEGRYDAVLSDWRGRIRELSAQFSLGQQFDIKAGRQILTWGTGDYLFLNDLFPKDWQSFFAGREDEYLKAPSDAVKASGYFDWFNLDLVYSPEFDGDNYISGDYFSFFNPRAGGVIAPQPGFNAKRPSGDEWALRLFRNIKGKELALYAYDGYYKSPEALSAEGVPTFSGLQTLGASIRMPLGSGLFNAEISHHRSKEDGKGENPRIPNSQWRALLGYEQEVITRLTGSVQFYLEHTQNHAALLANSPFPDWEAEQNRVVLTNRLTWRNQRDDLSLSLFTFYSPTDQDGYLRPALDYRLDDNWSMSAGMNLFFGEDEHSFFGQFKDNNNLYGRIRYSF